VELPDEPSASSNGLPAGTAGPDADGLALHGVLSTECAGVGGVLGDFELLGHLPQGSTITGSVLSDNPDLLGSLGLRERKKK